MEVHIFVLPSVEVPVGLVGTMVDMTFGGVLLTRDVSAVGVLVLLVVCTADFCEVPRGLKAMGFLKDGDESLPSLSSTSHSFRNFAGFLRFLERLVRFSPSLSSLVLSIFEVYKSLSALLLASDKVPTYTHTSLEVSKHNEIYL